MKVELDSTVSSVPYICTLSPQIRAGLKVMNLNGDGFRRVAVSIVEDFDSNAELKASLQQRPPQGGQFLRQVDIRLEADEPVRFKFFVAWNHELNMWHLFVEGGSEMVFENGEVT